ncbi:hypothetical protein FIBSPDRAFT_60290 [Athelia psychrophila]|uniref:Ubiquitin-like domain-containing protein n=1 Tax=Athelia psychrophila TaxID=1759441 RepID=A0A166F4X6_9AGAM|nr:hypothetical protein FIBSPDRAFT_60290 [Fibularhizoctonia sp. CBS 109695]
MQTTTTIHMTVRTLTGKSFPIDVDPTHTVGQLKATIVTTGKGKSIEVPRLEYKGHELRDTRRVDHYGLVANDVLYILPPSKAPNISLELIREDRGSAFDFTVSSGITVAKLREEIKIEEKIAVRQLKLVNNLGDEDEGGVVTLLEMQDDKAISECSVERQKVLVNNAVWEGVSAASDICILVWIDDRIQDTEGSQIGVTVRLDQTLGSFKKLLFDKHSFRCTKHSLILNSRELKNDDHTLGCLHFVDGCTVNAGR